MMGSAQEFYERYAARSGINPLELAACGQRAYRCECGEKGCEGWAMLSVDLVEEHRRDGVTGFLLAGVSPDDKGWSPAVVGEGTPDQP
jgi:hypothetical protein